VLFLQQLAARTLFHLAQQPSWQLLLPARASLSGILLTGCVSGDSLALLTARCDLNACVRQMRTRHLDRGGRIAILDTSLRPLWLCSRSETAGSGVGEQVVSVRAFLQVRQSSGVCFPALHCCSDSEQRPELAYRSVYKAPAGSGLEKVSGPATYDQEMCRRAFSCACGSHTHRRSEEAKPQ